MQAVGNISSELHVLDVCETWIKNNGDAIRRLIDKSVQSRLQASSMVIGAWSHWNGSASAVALQNVSEILDNYYSIPNDTNEIFHNNHCIRLPQSIPG